MCVNARKQDCLHCLATISPIDALIPPIDEREKKTFGEQMGFTSLIISHSFWLYLSHTLPPQAFSAKIYAIRSF